MGRRNPHNGDTVAVMDMHDFPVTVTEHKRRRNGMTLVTIDPDPDRNLVTFDGTPEDIRFAGDEPPEEDE